MSHRYQVSRWQSNLTLQFVRTYLKYECLWNPKHEDYKNRKKKEEAYKLVADDLKDFIKLDVNRVKFKIKSLRTTYSQEVAKILRNSTDPDHIYESTLIWFRAMDDCLKDIVSPRVSMQIRRDMSDWNDSWEGESSNDSSEMIDDKQDLNEALKKTDPINIKDPILDMTDADQKTTSTIFSIPSQPIDTQTYEDEYDLFGKYVAAQLRKLQLKPSLRAKQDILNILSTARLADTRCTLDNS